MRLESLLSRLNGYGGPIAREHRENVRMAVLRPSEERWDLIYGVLISPRYTVWQAVKSVDPKCPKVLASSRRWRALCIPF